MVIGKNLVTMKEVMFGMKNVSRVLLGNIRGIEHLEPPRQSPVS
jgi:hypothetical protein